MTDKEIKEALDYCVNYDSCNTSVCPFSDDEEEACMFTALKSALGLINRLQAENEGLRDEVDHLYETIDDLYETGA